jgi:hypothetical protein
MVFWGELAEARLAMNPGISALPLIGDSAVSKN